MPMTLVSYCKKKNKNVILQSIMHYNNDIIIEAKPRVMKSKIEKFYNFTKCGVDMTDQMCSIYDMTRICNYGCNWDFFFSFAK